MNANQPGALAGLKVLELTDDKVQFLGKLFADMGADVVLVEPPDGHATRGIGPFYRDQPDPEKSLHWWHYNTSKRGITVDLQSKDGRALLKRLSGKFDVVLEACEPGYLDRLGLGYDALKRVNGGLIVVSITPFGSDTPWSHFKTSDLVSNALGGFAWSCGYNDRETPPIRAMGNQSWHTGCHWGFIGALAAINHRDLTGRGQHVEVNIHAAMNVSTEAATYMYTGMNKIVQRQTGRHAAYHGVPTPPTNHLCKDGKMVNFGIPRDPEAWKAFVEWMDRDGMADDLKTNPKYAKAPTGRSSDEGFHVAEVVRRWCAIKSSGELFHGLQKLRGVTGIIYAPEDVVNDPHYRERGFMVPVKHEEIGATFEYPGAPYRLTASPWRISRRAPMIGEHTEEVLEAELGLSHDQIEGMKLNGTV